MWARISESELLNLQLCDKIAIKQAEQGRKWQLVAHSKTGHISFQSFDNYDDAEAALNRMYNRLNRNSKRD